MERYNPVAITADRMREVDRLMTEVYHITLDQMMENAGRNLADLATEILYRKRPKKHDYYVVVACGTGNNGGGGMVAARFLSNRNLNVTVVLAGHENKLKPGPYERWKTVRRLPVSTIVANSSDSLGVFRDTDLIIDAIIGYGLNGKPRGIPAHVIREIMTIQNGDILSLDVPSGLDSTDGSWNKPCIHADSTMTLALPKKGLLSPVAHRVVGDLYLADIGVPPSLYKHLGLPSLPLFSEETVLSLKSSV